MDDAQAYLTESACAFIDVLEYWRNKSMSKIPVSVCIIAKNEEKFIEDCLKHLLPYGMEIIVADTGSTDRTKEIAQKYADQVVDFEWINDFAAARNYCASFAKNNWILAIDCDEIVQSVDVRVLRMLMQKHARYTGVLRLKNITDDGRGHKGYVNTDVPRMYNKNFYKFDYHIHEQLVSIDPAKKDDALNGFLLPIDIIHYGYALDDEAMAKKQNRNLELLYKELESTPDKGYVYFQIGQSQLSVNAIEAVESYEKAMENLPGLDRYYVPDLIMSLAKAYDDVNRTPDALALMEKYAKDFNTAKYVFTYADILWKDGQMLKALGNYIKVTTLPDMGSLGGELTECYGRIIQIYEAFGEEEMAKNFHQRFLAYHADKEKVISTQ